MLLSSDYKDIVWLSKHLYSLLYKMYSMCNSSTGSMLVAMEFLGRWWNVLELEGVDRLEAHRLG